MLCSGLSTALLPGRFFSPTPFAGEETPSPPRQVAHPTSPWDAKRSPYLASQVQHVSVGVVEREEETREPVDLLLYQGHGEVFLRSRQKHLINQDVPMLVPSGGPSRDGAGVPAPTWSQRAICRVFQRDTPVVSSRFVLPRKTTRLTRWFLQLASCKTRSALAGSLPAAAPRPGPCPGKAPSLAGTPTCCPPLPPLLPRPGETPAPCWWGGSQYGGTVIQCLSPVQNKNARLPSY